MSGDVRTILVGTDGSTAARAAVDHAARLAAREHARLTILHAHEFPYGNYATLGAVYPVTAAEEDRRGAGEFLKTEGDRVRAEFPGVPEVRVLLADGGAARPLIDNSRTAAVTVVGSRGAGGFGQLVLGSVSAQVAAHADGVVEVVPVPDGRRPDAPVAVGHDGSRLSDLALRFAAGEALARGVTLMVTRFYDPDDVFAARLASEAVAAIAERMPVEFPGLKVDARALPVLSAAHGLAELSWEACLTVVGSRGHGGFVGLLLGSVSQALLHHAHGPVAVVHERKRVLGVRTGTTRR